MKFETVEKLDVRLNFGEGILQVGRLATRNHEVFFEYDKDFSTLGLEISPIKLALNSGLYRSNGTLFEGLPGVFEDSLPDGWGRLLFDRAFENADEAGPLDRLAQVGNAGIGALSYHPVQKTGLLPKFDSLDSLSKEAHAILSKQGVSGLDALLQLNGGSAGARPKVQVWVAGETLSARRDALPVSAEPWIIKFPNLSDGIESGAVEFDFSLKAKAAGIQMPETRLFPSKIGPGYFGVKRFDYLGSQRFHVHTAAGLLHSDFRMPSLDYKDLIRLTAVLTKDQRQVERLFRLAIFNVLAENKDDHAKNFSYLMDAYGQWSLAPAYDLTPSEGMFGHQSTSVMGESHSISKAALVELGVFSGLGRDQALSMVEEIQDCL